jgi:hypothetical protein
MLKPKHPGLLVLFVVTGVLVLVVFVFFPSLSDPKCVALLTRSEGDATIPLPANCVPTSELPAGRVAQYLENERIRRGLIFKRWITCETSHQTSNFGFAFEHDARWLPSYVPRTYQFRRTVVILPDTVPAPQGSPVAAEVTLIPWRMYLSEIAGQCDGKFSVWK